MSARKLLIVSGLILLGLCLTGETVPSHAAVPTIQPNPIISYYSNISIDTVDLANGVATVTVKSGFTALGNWSGDIYLQVYGVENSYVGQIHLVKQQYQAGYSYFQDANTSQRLLVLMKGASAFYPYDSYVISLNFTYPQIGVGNFSAPQREGGIGGAYVWPFSPARANQFNQPSYSENWTLKNNQFTDTVTITFERRSWVAWTVFAPILMLILMLGFTTLMPAKNHALSGRIVIQITTFLAFLGYYAVTSPTFPPVSSFVPLPLVLLYSGLSASTVFLLATAFVQDARAISETVVDTVAALSSVILLDFFLYTILLANLPIQPGILQTTSYLQLAVMLALFSGLMIKAVRERGAVFSQVLRILLPRRRGYPSIATARFFYWTALALNLGALLLTIYLVTIYGPDIKLTPSRRILFYATERNLAATLTTQLVFSLGLFALVYRGLQRFPRLWTLAAPMYFLLTLADFVNDDFLLWLPVVTIPYNLNILLLPVLLIAIWAIANTVRTKRIVGKEVEELRN